MSSPSPLYTDVLIVGAGLSGIGAARYVQLEHPHKSWAILEARERLGGTWDLFRYPGVRSDSDMYTLGYSFRPWTSPKAIADGPSILAYIRETAEAYGIDRHIVYGARVERASFSRDTALWTVHVRDARTGELVARTCRFLYGCTGYYSYESGYTPELDGRERYKGLVVHPQSWPESLDTRGLRVVVVGSGATAVTLVPALAETAAHVVMLQRSPTYVVSAPMEDAAATWLRGVLPGRAAYAATRWKNVARGMATYAFCRQYPEQAKRLIVGEAKRQLGDSDALGEGFVPAYAPWDQRVCLVPDGDLFRAIRRGAASVVTDRIETFTETGLRLQSGRDLDADLVVTATGLRLEPFGSIAVDVDGAPYDLPGALVYKGMMCSDLPNFAFAIGYTNASWTLKCELTSRYVCRLLAAMDAKGARTVVARRPASVEPRPLIDFSSGYVQRAIDRFPKQGSAPPWRLYQNYALDTLALRFGKLDDGTLELA